MPPRPSGVALRRIVILAALAAAALTGTTGTTTDAREDADDAPLTNEDVVRRFVMGTSESDLIALIRTSRVAFDVTDEMIDELRLAGIPAGLLRAMIERQRAQDAASRPASGAATDGTEPEAPPVRDPGEPTLTVILNAAPAKEPADADRDTDPERPSLRVLDVVHPELIERLGLRAGSARVTDIAIFLGCRTADHVPDQWRSQSPLGRDFSGTPRHRMLLFVGGATKAVAGKRVSRVQVPEGEPPPAVLELEIPASITTPLEPDVVHDLSIGIALEIGGRYYLVVRDDLDGILLGAGLPGTHEGHGRLRAVVETPSDPMQFGATARFESTQLE